MSNFDFSFYFLKPIYINYDSTEAENYRLGN